MPLSSTSNSPSAASRIGVAIATVEAKNASSIGAPPPPRAPRAGRVAPPPRRSAPLKSAHVLVSKASRIRITIPWITCTSTGETPWARCIACEPLSSAPKSSAVTIIAERIEPRDQRHRDRLETPSGRELLVQPMGDRRNLHRAAKPGQRARQRHRPNRERRDRDAEESRGAPIAAHRAQLETATGVKETEVRSRARGPPRAASRS